MAGSGRDHWKRGRPLIVCGRIDEASVGQLLIVVRTGESATEENGRGIDWHDGRPLEGQGNWGLKFEAKNSPAKTHLLLPFGTLQCQNARLKHIFIVHSAKNHYCAAGDRAHCVSVQNLGQLFEFRPTSAGCGVDFARFRPESTTNNE